MIGASDSWYNGLVAYLSLLAYFNYFFPWILEWSGAWEGVYGGNAVIIEWLVSLRENSGHILYYVGNHDSRFVNKSKLTERRSLNIVVKLLPDMHRNFGAPDLLPDLSWKLPGWVTFYTKSRVYSCTIWLNTCCGPVLVPGWWWGNTNRRR